MINFRCRFTSEQNFRGLGVQSLSGVFSECLLRPHTYSPKDRDVIGDKQILHRLNLTWQKLA